MWTHSRRVCAWLVAVTAVCLLEEVSGWASFKHLSREKRALMESMMAVEHDDHNGSGGRGGGSRQGGRRRFSDGSILLNTVVVTAPRLPARRPVGFQFPFRLPSGGSRRGTIWGGAPARPMDFQFPFRFPSRGGGRGRGTAPVRTPPPPPPPVVPATPVPEPPEDKDAKKKTFDQFIYQLEKLESLLPESLQDQMAHKLRMLVPGYNSFLWKQMLNVNNPIPLMGRDVEEFKMPPGRQGIFNQLREMMAHKVKSGTELGVIKVNGETVALGHVITGATAGYDNQKFLGMDNLFSATISGDLGQSGLKNSKDPTSPVIGPAGTWKNGKYEITGKGGEATRAEILGDIDGFNIGKRIMADRTKPLSQHLREYYTRESSRRFDIFKGHTTKAALKAEVYKFANLYDYKEAGMLASVLRNSSPELAVRRATEIDRIATSAVNSFCTAFSSELGTSWCK